MKLPIIVLLAIWATSLFSSVSEKPYLMIIGVAQDAGYPQAGCQRECCQLYWDGQTKKNWVSSAAVVLPEQKKYFLLDATPDIKEQMQFVEHHTGFSLGGIFLTHAHIGHYTGLMHLGREAMGADNIPVYVMPKMLQFLTDNGPWSQLVDLGNIQLFPLQDSIPVHLGQTSIMPFLVPHRDEFSETVGYEINFGNRSGLFIPDIDKWHKWDHDIRNLVHHDFLVLDGTFYRNGEIFGRDMSLIPHPFIEESLLFFKKLSKEEKTRIIFTHFNHTNPVIWDQAARQKVQDSGFRLAYRGMQL